VSLSMRKRDHSTRRGLLWTAVIVIWTFCLAVDAGQNVETGKNSMNGEFWVIFDTSTLRDYYQDVHNLLAMPEGFVIRYEYRTKYLSDEAIKLAESAGARPVLFLYTQRDTEYPRNTDGTSFPRDRAGAELYFATRVGTMINVTRDGDNYYFDFQVAEYPNQDQGAIEAIRDELYVKGSVPLKNGKWVATSSLMDKLEVLKLGETQQNWAEIVHRLSTPPVQFSGDAFWRVEGPFQPGNSTAIKPSLKYDTPSGRPPQARSFFYIPENSSWKFDLVSETSGKAQYSVEGKSSDTGTLTIMGTPTYGLRQYTRQDIEYRAQSTALFGQAAADLSLETVPHNGEWPSGPKLTFRYELQRNWRRIALGFASGIAGLLLLALSGFILTGKISFKP
jgi:hypothetical protein